MQSTRSRKVIKFTSCLHMVGRWFSPGTLASSTTKTGRHDIAEILLKVALNTKIQIQIQKHILEVINGTQKNTTLLTLENHILNVTIDTRKKHVIFSPLKKHIINVTMDPKKIMDLFIFI